MKFLSSTFLSLTVLCTAIGVTLSDEVVSTHGVRGAPANNQNILGTPEKKPTRRVVLRYRGGHKTKTLSVLKATSDKRSVEEPAIKIDHDFEELNALVITGSVDEIDMIQNDPEVESVEDDPVRYPMAVKGSNADISRFFSGDSRELVQTMPYGIDLVQAPKVWEKNATGQGVKVCVIDSGIQSSHPDFVTSNLNGFGAWNQDGYGHGTHVSGTIAGKDDNAGVIGVAPDAKIFTVRVFGNDCGLAYASGIYKAARTCQSNGADIISMSLGGPYGSAIESSVFDDIFASGILLVAAAGNDGDTAFNYPASYNSVMSVAAVDSSKNVAAFSQRNSAVDIAAPGVAILSAFPVGGCTICRWDTNGYGSIDGTSMAAPHVSAVGALLKSAVPDATASDLRNAMELSALDLGTVGKDHFYGHGLVQAKKALQVLTGESDNSGGSDNGGAQEGSSECKDSPQGWHDSDGFMYDCDWYAQGINCFLYGNSFGNQGKTANEACCACNGGTTDGSIGGSN